MQITCLACIAYFCYMGLNVYPSGKFENYVGVMSLKLIIIIFS